MRAIRALVCVTFILSLLAIMPATPAQALTGTITVFPVTGPPGTLLSVTGSGFTAGSSYTVNIGGAGAATGTVDPAGNISSVAVTVPNLARGPWNVTVTTAAPASDTSNAVVFNITPSIILDYALGRVGDTIRVSGKGFAASSLVTIYFDDIAATTVTADPSGLFTSVAFIVPSSSPGQHSVKGYDGLAFSPVVYFTVMPKLTFTPNVQTVGSQIVMSGNGYTINTPITFYIDNVAVATNAVVADINGSFADVSLTVPPLTQGAHTLKAQDTNSNAGTGTLYVRPSLSLSPQTATPGASVMLTGNGFAASQTVTVTYNNAAITTSPSPATTNPNGTFTASFTVPAGTSGSYSVQASDGTNSASTAFAIASAAELKPTTGPVGTDITVTGRNFNASSNVVVSFDGTQVATTKADASGSFSASFKAPNGRAGNHLVVATDAVNSVTLNYNMTSTASISPTNGAVDSSATISGSGLGMSRPVVIAFDKVQVGTANTDSFGSLTATIKVPPSAAGTHQVAVLDNQNVVVSMAFNVQPSATITPATAPVGGNLTVKGSGFAANKPVNVTYEKIPVATVVTDASGSFTAAFKVPASSSGSHQVTASDGTNTINLTNAVTPVITINPDAGYVGSNVAVQGNGFGAGKTVSIKYDNSQVAQATSDANGTFAATFSTPASKSGSHLISITDGASTLTSDFTMDSTPPPAPVPAQPADTTKAPALASFSWSPVTDPSGISYTIQLAPDATFSSILVEKQGLADPGYTLTDTEKLKTVSKEKPYYWRTRAIDGAGNESPWSAAKTFYVGFTLARGVTYAIFGVVALIIGILGFWLGRKTYPF